MRAVIQRVSKASVTINNVVAGSIGKGIVVLLGVEDADTVSDVEWLAAKIVNLRIFDDAAGVMNINLQEAQGDILLISQFTLFASTRKGNRPSYMRASKPEVAVPLYEMMIKKLEHLTERGVEKGIFGADMQVALVNDGPVTIIIDSKLRE
jgi:D-tyrosyl-tRNA(Tyr) deacylase